MSTFRREDRDDGLTYKKFVDAKRKLEQDAIAGDETSHKKLLELGFVTGTITTINKKNVTIYKFPVGISMFTIYKTVDFLYNNKK
jgi:hypothetical protein